MTERSERIGHTRRLSVTKLQRQTVPGAEIIALCQTITEDGSLSDFEILELETWLVSNESTDLPARDHLVGVLRSAAADGVISSDERSQLYKEIELILPPDIRAVVRRTRRANERTQKTEETRARLAAREAVIAEARAAKQAAREAELRKRPVSVLDFMVAGVTYEGRADIVDAYCDFDDPVFLIRDRINNFSRNAVEVRISNGMQIGFVPESLARDIASLLDAGYPHIARIKKILTGSRAPIPVVFAALYRSDSERPDLVFERQVPVKTSFENRSERRDA